MSRLMRGDVSGRVRLIGAAAPYPRLAKANVRREPDLCPVRRWSICDQDKCDTAHIYLQHIHIADNHRTAAPPGSPASIDATMRSPIHCFIRQRIKLPPANMPLHLYIVE
jgi:hypothetical protein